MHAQLRCGRGEQHQHMHICHTQEIGVHGRAVVAAKAVRGKKAVTAGRAAGAPLATMVLAPKHTTLNKQAVDTPC